MTYNKEKAGQNKYKTKENKTTQDIKQKKYDKKRPYKIIQDKRTQIQTRQTTKDR